MRSSAKPFRRALAVHLVVLVIGGIAFASHALDEVSVQLKWIHQAQFAGFYVADVEGFYEEEGIDVTFLPGGLGVDLFEGIASGDVEFSVVGADHLLVELAKGIPAIAIATTYRINPFVLVAFADSGIVSPYDLPGRTVAVTASYDSAQFHGMLKNVGVDPTQINLVPYTYDDTPFLEGEVDVTVSFAAGSLLPLREKTGDRELNLIWPDDYGVHFYSDTIIVTTALLVEDPDLILRFLHATLRGHRYAIEHPEAAIEASMAYAVVQDRAVQEAMFEASIPLIHTGEDQIGWMRSDVWQHMYDVLLAQGILSVPFDIATAFTREFLEVIYDEE